jgi:thermostable 8-oxoguanine DNA glycosylase
MTLHPIDTVKKEWSDEDLERMMVFCLLDRASPYPTVCRCFNLLDDCGLTTRAYIRKQDYPYKGREWLIDNRLRLGGYPFPNQTAKFITEFAWNEINLRTCTREELVEKVNGIGYKLASMFLRNTRGTQYAVIDVHIKNWLVEHGYKLSSNYKKMEEIFIKEAEKRNKTPYDFDMEIWEERRRKFKE